MKNVVIRDTKRGLIVQKRPTPDKRQWTDKERAYQTRFAWAATNASSPFPTDLATAIEMAKGTQQVPRDILTMAALGRYYEIELSNGVTMGHVRGPTVYLPNQELQEMWTWNRFDSAFTGSIAGSAAAAKGMTFVSQFQYRVPALRFVVDLVSGGTYQAMVGTVDGSNVIQTLVKSQSQIATVSARRVLHFDINAVIPANITSLVMVARLDAGDTYVLPVVYSPTAKFLAPLVPGVFANVPKASPAVGDSLISPSVNYPSVGIYLDGQWA